MGRSFCIRRVLGLHLFHSLGDQAMTDIVDRLREHAATSSYLTECRPRGLICKAADEIERLREALWRIGMPDQDVDCSKAGHLDAVLRARRALLEDER